MINEENNFLPSDNSEVKKYLEYYIKLNSPPGYAIFINGPWGSGKTWFIKQFIQENNPENFIHVSLYGVISAEGIEEQFFQQLHPFLSSKKVSFTIKGIKSALSKFGISADHFDIKEFLSKTTEKILIFDDLERCKAIPEALGFINRFIEHSGNKVIILGDESNILETSFGDQKEKTIGRSFTIVPEFKITFDYLVNLSDQSQSKIVLENNYSLIESCFKRAGCKNLRTLKYCVMEFQRFFEQLPEKARTHVEFMTNTVNTFFSLCIEIRSGKLKVHEILKLQEAFTSDVVNKVSSRRNNDEKIEINPLSEIRKKHFGEGFNEIEPNLELLYYFFEYGSLHEQFAIEVIDNCSYFLIDKTPSWIKLWHYYSLRDDDFTNYYYETLEAFKNFKFTRIGELRHIVGMLLNYSKKSLIEMNYDDALNLSKAIIQNMTDNKLIEPEINDRDFHPFDDASHGMQFQSLDDYNFILLSGLIKDGSKVAQELSHKDIAQAIPEIIKENPRKFWSLICSGGGDEIKEKLYRYPVMKYVDIEKFIQSIIDLNPSNTARFTVFHALKDRYQHHSYSALKEDLAWIEELKGAMESKLPSLKQPTKIQFESFISMLNGIIENLKTYQ